MIGDGRSRYFNQERVVWRARKETEGQREKERERERVGSADLVTE